jgi:hypothetical protein
MIRPQNTLCVRSGRLMELLAPLARRSRIVTALLANEMGVLARLLSVISEPLTLSLGARPRQLCDAMMQKRVLNDVTPDFTALSLTTAAQSASRRMANVTPQLRHSRPGRTGGGFGRHWFQGARSNGNGRRDRGARAAAHPEGAFSNGKAALLHCPPWLGRSQP